MRQIRSKIGIFVIIYIVVIIVILSSLNSKRSAEYTYQYDLSTFSSGEWNYSSDIGLLSINELMVEGENNTDSKMTVLPSGDYTIKIEYSSSNTNVVHIYSDTNLDEYVYLPEGNESYTYNFSVWPSTDIFTVSLIYKGVGNLEVKSIALISNVPMNNDYEYYMFLVLLAGICMPFILFFLWKKCGYDKKEWLVMGILTAIITIVSVPAFYGYLWMGTDTRHHLMRMQGVTKALEERRFPTIIYSNYLNEYSELSCIYPDKFLYLSAMLRHFNVSIVTAYNTTIVLINIVSVIAMYFCTKYITKKRIAGALAAGLFGFIPYRMYVMYGGGQAFGMGIAMIFFIVLFTALYDLFFLEGKKWFLLPIAITGLISCHILSFIFAIINCVIVAIVCSAILVKIDNGFREQRKIYVKVVASIGVTIILGMSTIVPFTYYYMQGLSVDQMQLDFLMSLGDFKSNFMSENGLFYIGIAVLTACGCIVIRRLNRQSEYHEECDGNEGVKNHIMSTKYVGYMILMLVLGFGYFIGSTSVFPWKLLSKVEIIKRGLDYFQFGERFMLAGSATTCIGIAMLFTMIIERGWLLNKGFEIVNKKNFVIVVSYLNVIAGVLVVIAMVLGVHKCNSDIAMCDELCPDRMTGNIYCTEVGYIPAGTKLEDCESQIPYCKDWASVENLVYLRNGTKTHYEYVCYSDDNSMEFPILNYKGYKAYDGNGSEIEIVNSDRNRILINLVKSNDIQTIDIVFEEFFIFKACAMISFLCLIGLIGYIFYKERRAI